MQRTLLTSAGFALVLGFAAPHALAADTAAQPQQQSGSAPAGASQQPTDRSNMPATGGATPPSTGTGSGGYGNDATEHRTGQDERRNADGTEFRTGDDETDNTTYPGE
ncbi:MAG: hypothetical protein ACK4VV_06020 [Pseudomonas sp.]